MGEKPSEEDVQKKMLQFQILEGNLRAVRGQLEQAAGHIEDMSRTKMALEELDKVKPNDSAMIPIGAGTFVRGKITNSEDVLVSIGTDMAVMKTRAEALTFIEGRLAEMRKAAEELMAQEKVVVKELQRLQPEIQRMLQG